MAEGALSPAFFRLFYHTLYAPHVATIPTLLYAPPSTGVPEGTFETWDGVGVAGDVMIQAYVDALRPFVPVTTIFDEAVIFQQDTETALPQPVHQIALGDAGTGVAGTPAAQVTNTFRTSTFTIFKVVLLDINPTVLWAPIRDISTSPNTEALLAVISDEANGFSGRTFGRPKTFIQASFTLNEKLRRQYRYN